MKTLNLCFLRSSVICTEPVEVSCTELVEVSCTELVEVSVFRASRRAGSPKSMEDPSTGRLAYDQKVFLNLNMIQ